MRRRANPWPALVDLFSALLIGTFAGLMLMHKQSVALSAQLQANEKLMAAKSALDVRVHEIATKLQEQLRQDSRLASRVTSCGGDVCLDLDVHFALNSRDIDRPQELDALDALCPLLRSELERLDPAVRDDVEIIIEGHTDSTRAKLLSDPREAWLFNWDLSSKRAGTVLYELSKCGIQRPAFHVTAVGLSHWDPVSGCTGEGKDCRQSNRRTTLRFRANTERMGRKAGTESSEPEAPTSDVGGVSGEHGGTELAAAGRAGEE